MWNVLSTRVKLRTLRRKARRGAAPKRPLGRLAPKKVSQPPAASTDLPKDHQKSIPANGQLRVRQTSGNIPLGTHSLFAGFTGTYGNCAMRTGKFRARGPLFRISHVLRTASTLRCLSGVSGGTMTSILPVRFGLDEYEAMDPITPKSRKFRTGHKSTKQIKSCAHGRTHRKGKLRC
jgi:hypothetical protein